MSMAVSSGHVTRGNAEGTESDDEFSPVASASVSYSPASNFTFTARSVYEWEDSTSTGGGRSSWDNSLGMSWKMTQKLTLDQSIGVEDINEKNSDADSTEYSYDLRASYQLTQRFSVYSGYEYARTTFKNGDYREYDCHEIYLGARYSF
jgi:predicted porin